MIQMAINKIGREGGREGQREGAVALLLRLCTSAGSIFLYFTLTVI